MKYFIGFLLTVALVVIVFILVIRGFTGDKTPKNVTVLADHSNSSMVVKLTVDGEVTAEQNHVGYRIIIDRSQAVIETYKGYENEITNTKTYVNNTEAYASFLRALDIAGLTKGEDDSKNTDERGVCADGSRYIYEIKNGPDGDKRYWSTSCGGGTFKGDQEDIRQLFRRQIPDFSQIAGRLDLES